MADSPQQYSKSRLSRMRNVRANAAGMLRRAPSFLPDSSNINTNSGIVVNRVGSNTKLKRSNSSSSTFYVQLPLTKSVNRFEPRCSCRRIADCHESETSGCESGTYKVADEKGHWFYLVWSDFKTGFLLNLKTLIGFGVWVLMVLRLLLISFSLCPYTFLFVL